MNPTLLVGNGFAILAAAVELVLQGKQVTILTDGKTLGGHFAGLNLDGIDFDIGMVFVEESSVIEPGANLNSYDPNRRNDWTRFGDRASNWIRSKVDLVRAQTPMCMVSGTLIPDYLIANRLDGLTCKLSPKALSRIDPRHSIHKSNFGAYETLTYAEAAFHNHGHDWHQTYIDPFVKKVFGVHSTEFLARFHRAAWAPLYYPETLKMASLGQSTGLPEYPFWTTPNGFVGQLVRNLCEILSKSPKVYINNRSLRAISRSGGVWAISTADGELHQSRQLAIGMPAERICNLLGVQVAKTLPAASVSLLLAIVKADHIRSPHGCTMIVEGSYATYRLTDHDVVAGLSPSWHRIVIEASPLSLAKLHPGKSMEAALLDELANLLGIDLHDAHNIGAIRILRCFTAQNTLPIPTTELVSQASEMATLLAKAAPGAKLTGSLLGYGVASLNDQLIQALTISQEFS